MATKKTKKETAEKEIKDVETKATVSQEEIALATLEALKSIKEEIKSDKEAKEVKSSEPKRRKTVEIEPNELIDVRSVTHGGLTYISPKTNMKITWRRYGDTQPVEYSELLTMRATTRVFLEEPCIVIDDEQVAEKLGLTKLYEQLSETEDLDAFFNKSVIEMQEKIKKAPRGIKEAIRYKASELVRNGSLYDMRKIKMLEEELRLDLMILID